MYPYLILLELFTIYLLWCEIFNNAGLSLSNISFPLKKVTLLFRVQILIITETINYNFSLNKLIISTNKAVVKLEYWDAEDSHAE